MRRLKSLTIVLIIAALTLIGTVPSFTEPVSALDKKASSIDATSAILMDAKSGEILYEKNAYEKRDPASITKILNCMVVLDTLDIDDEISIDYQPDQEGSVMGLKKDEKLTVRDLVYGMMLVSGNDAAEVLAKLAGGNTETFCSMMNERAKACGARDTTYTNPNGLNPYGKVNNVTTAFDIATIAASAMNNSEFAEIVGTEQYIVPASNKSKARKMQNSNFCLENAKYNAKYKELASLKYKGCVGVKTGYSSTAGDCFCGFAKRGRTELIVVVLNASNEKAKFTDAGNLWDYGFKNYKSYRVAQVGEVQEQLKVARGSLREVDLGLSKDLNVTIDKNQNGDETITTEVLLDKELLTSSGKVSAPIKKGTEVGRLLVYDRGEKIAEGELVSMETASKGGFLSYIGIAEEDVLFFLIGIAALIILVLVIIHLLRKKREKDRIRSRSKNQRKVKQRERERERDPFGMNKQ